MEGFHNKQQAHFAPSEGFHNKQQAHFAPSSNANNRILRIVYAFAGHRRRADVHEHLQTLADEFGFTLEMHEFDLLRDEKQNLLDESFWEELKTLIRDLRPFCVIATPPCSTYSRARNHYSERPGPRPIRSREHPRGFPWLAQKDKIKADEGTLLAERTWELFNLASDVGAHYLGEFPEDLGATKNGIPASIWQMQQFQDLLVLPGCRTFAIFQCEFGAETPKPTRFVSDLKFFEGNIFPGVPQFDKAWNYKGPLPPHCPHGGDHPQLIGVNELGQWKTAPAAHYPGALCLFIARAIAKTWAASSSASRGLKPADAQPAIGGKKVSNAAPNPQVDKAVSAASDLHVSAVTDFSISQPVSASSSSIVPSAVSAAPNFHVGSEFPCSQGVSAVSNFSPVASSLSKFSSVANSLEEVSIELSSVVEGPSKGQTKPLADDLEIKSGCTGPPLVARYGGKAQAFCDGMGLCCPGRWHPKLRHTSRTTQQLSFCKSLRNLVDDFCRQHLPDMARATFALALGKMATSPFGREDMDSLREKWFALLPDSGKARQVPDGQPFWLFALSQSLRMMGDPDADIIDNSPGSSFAEGVHLGHLEPLGPTPQVYRAREKEPSYDESEWMPEVGNYFRGDETAAEKILEEQFREEEKAGRMFPLSEKEAARRYPGRALRVAAQGILEKPDGGHRIIHDATHGVRLNNEIVILDRLENPGPRELATIMEVSQDSGEHVIFGLNADVAKAHRRVLVKESDWGVQACRTSSRSPVIWLNRTGTFGVASAAFWWSRLMALLGRFAYNLSEQDWLFVLVFVDDLHLAAGGQNRWLTIWRFLVALEMVGVPFSYPKFRGGFQMDYVGYWMDYSRFELGLSERRANWLVKFVEDLQSDGWLTGVKQYQEFHGRLGFASQVLPWIRPLLGPGYAWLAAVSKGTTLKVPALLATTCVFIKEKFKAGLRKLPCGSREEHLGEVFRTDAEGRIVLGGWELGESSDPYEASWFALELGPEEVPWLFKDRSSSWASTSAELLAAVVALQVFNVRSAPSRRASHVLHCGGGTDNKAAESLSAKGLSTKFPLMIVLMEYLAICERKHMRVQLEWRPRESNVEADDLTNLEFGKFDLKKRISVSWSDLKFPMIEMLMKFTESFSKRKFDLENQPHAGPVQKFTKTKWG